MSHGRQWQGRGRRTSDDDEDEDEEESSLPSSSGRDRTSTSTGNDGKKDQRVHLQPTMEVENLGYSKNTGLGLGFGCAPQT